MALTKTRLKNVIFDFDGTLIDSSRDVKRILFETVNKYGANLSSSKGIKLGPPMFQMIQSVAPQFSDEKIEKVLVDYAQAYADDPLDETIPFDGVVEMLETLKRNDIGVFIATYKPKELAVDSLNKFFKGLFIDAVTPSEIENFEQGKTKSDIINLIVKCWGISIEDSIMVGDACTDISCAKVLGMDAVGVLYGYGDSSEFDDADYVAKSVSELNRCLLGLIKG